MNRKEKAAAITAALKRNLKEQYQSSSPRSIHLPRFSQDIKQKWQVKRDECGDEFIRLNGKTALLNGGLDHIYLINEKIVGVWLTTRQIESRFEKLKKMVPGIKIEQLGDGEGVLSCSIKHLDKLCEGVRARKRRKLSEKSRKRLCDINPQLNREKTTINWPTQGPDEPKKTGGGL